MIYFASIELGHVKFRSTGKHAFYVIKIGCSKNPKERVYVMRYMYKVPVKLLGTMPGGRYKEKELHQRFRKLKFAGQSKFSTLEWFLPAGNLWNFISKYCDKAS